VPCDDKLPDIVADIIREREQVKQAALEASSNFVKEISNGLRESV
jgi:hypothetical protein